MKRNSKDESKQIEIKFKIILPPPFLIIPFDACAKSSRSQNPALTGNGGSWVEDGDRVYKEVAISGDATPVCGSSKG